MKIFIKFSQAKEAAERLLQEQERIKDVLSDALAKAEKQKPKISNFWENLKLLIQMVHAYINGNYKQIPWKTLLLSVAAILYFLNPLDMIPDFLPGLGYLDDATVLAFVVNSVKKDLEKFKLFIQGSIY
jgi:uncharacterized membrane protein YkvA (DUF1232 family)